MNQTGNTPLAIIGASLRLPGADNLEEYWRLLIEGRSAIVEIPEDRFNRELYYDPQQGVRAKSYTQIAGLTSNKPFDAVACPLPPEVVAQSDESHLKFCEVAAEAFRKANYDPFNLPQFKTGVYVGHTRGSTQVGDLEYATMVEQAAPLLKQTPSFAELVGAAGDDVIDQLVKSVRNDYPPRTKAGPFLDPHRAATLVGQAFNLDGPAMCVNAACASSLIAMSMAARALERKQIDVALIGGASYFKFDSLVLFSKAQSVSALGSRPFDEQADGFVSGEGFVAVLLKTLEQALDDGDPIMAVVRGIGMSSDGKGKSLWAPRKEGQAEAVRRAYDKGVDITRVQYIEAHATRAQVGDATELSALAEVFDAHLPPGAKVPVGGVKGNIGHTLETAGSAGLLKTLLAIQHGVIPPTINVDKLNAKFPWESSSLYVAKEAMPWPQPADGGPRCAAVNAFGIGGLNAHVIIDEYTPDFDWRSIIKTPAQPKQHSPEEEAIAIIGVSNIFPGAVGPDAFWDLALSGRDPKVEVPLSRWDASVGFAAGQPQPYRSMAKVGGFITDYEYDWKKHRTPPKHVANADPLQFMVLDLVDRALEDAGLLSKEFDRMRAGAVVGTDFAPEFRMQLQVGMRLPNFQHTLKQEMARRGVDPQRAHQLAEEFGDVMLEKYPALLDETGSFTQSTLASRITKTYNLMGGAAAVDSGGASAHAALSICSNMLLTGQVDLMICAAGQRSMGLWNYEDLSFNGMLASDLSHGAFDERAQGLVPGEGAGVVILKRLADAQRDGDRIRGVIRSIGVARSSDLQSAFATAINRSLVQAGVSPGEIGAVEATGLALPNIDAAEAAAILQTLGGDRTQPLAIGAIASQIGYLLGASGMASLFKSMAELQHLQMPSLYQFQQPLDQWKNQNKIIVPQQPAPLPVINEEGRALASVLSVGGLNQAYSAIIERPDKAPVTPPADPVKQAAPVEITAPVAAPAAPRIIRLGAESFPDMLVLGSQAAMDPAEFFNTAPDCFESKHILRMAIVASTPEEFAKKLELASEHALDRSAPTRQMLRDEGVFTSQKPETPPRVAFLFPGQGSQYPGMLGPLLTQYTPARNTLRQIDALFEHQSSPRFEQLAGNQEDGRNTDVGRIQLAMLAADIVLHASLGALGVTADCLSGHGYGEFPALIAAGAWSFETAAQATEARCKAINDCKKGQGATLSAGGARSVVERMVRDLHGRVFITNDNAPDQTILAGDEQSVNSLRNRLREIGIASRRVSPRQPFNTPLMQASRDPLSKAIAQMEIHPLSIPLLSSVDNRYLSDPQAVRENMVAQMTHPVRWVEVIRRHAADGVNVFVEVGPSQVLTRLGRKILGGDDVYCVATDHQTRGGLEMLLGVRALLETLGRFDDEPMEEAAIPPIDPRMASETIIDQADAETNEQPAEEDKSEATPETTPSPEPAADAKLLDLHGNRYAMGRAHGERRAVAIQTILRRYADMAGEESPPLPPVDPTPGNAESHFSADDLQELQGIADGAKVSLANLLAHNLRLQPTTPSGIQFALSAQLNGSAGLLQGVNVESSLTQILGDCLEQTISRRRPAQGIDHVVFGVAGGLGGSCGLNAAGLFVGSATLRGPGGDGPVVASLVLQLLQLAGTIDQAVQILQQASPRSTCAFSLSHAPTDAVCFVECIAGQVQVHQGAAAIAATNHSLLFSGVESTAASESRLQRLVEQLGGNSPGNLSAEEACAVLRDRQIESTDSPATDANLNRGDNQLSVLYAPQFGALWHTSTNSDGADSFESLRLDDLFSTTVEHPEASLPSPPARSGNVCQRFAVQTVPQPRAGALSAFQPQGPAIILGDNRFAHALRDQLQSLGAAAHIVSADQPAAIALEACTQIWQAASIPHLFIATGRGETPIDFADSASWAAQRESAAMLPVLLCQQWIQHVASAGMTSQSTLAAIVSLGGDFAAAAPAPSPEGGALSGLLKAIRVEISRKEEPPRIKVIDAPVDTPPEKLSMEVLAELASNDEEIEVAFRGDQRLVVRGVEEPACESPGRPMAEELSGAWVVTGGARGITAAVALELGKQFGAELHLLGSSPPPGLDASWRDLSDDELKERKRTIAKEALAAGKSPAREWEKIEKQREIDGNLRAFAAAGISAHYHQCDVADRAALAQTLAEVRTASGPIVGVMHGAGLRTVERLEKKKAEQVSATIGAKIDAAIALADLTRSDPLRCFIGFGSVSGRFGGNGGADYSLVNDMLAKFTSWLRQARPGVAATTVHWHPWADIGLMTRSINFGAANLMKLSLMPPSEGVQHLLDEIRIGCPRSEVLITDDAFYRHYYSTPLLQTRAVNALPSIAQVTAADTPLLDRVAEQSGEKLVAEINFDPVNDPFLREHLFKKKPFLPIVIAMEAFAEAASLVNAPGDQAVVVRNVEIQGGFKFFDQRQVLSRVYAEQSAGGVACRLTSEFRNRADKLMERDRPHMSAVVEHVDAEPFQSQGPQRPFPTATERSTWREVKYHDDLVIYHGPVFRAGKLVSIDGAGGVGYLVAPPTSEVLGARAGDHWLHNPPALDACLYICGVWWVVAADALGIPESFQTVRMIRRTRPNEECMLEFACTRQDERSSDFDFTLWGDDGSMILQVEGFRFMFVGKKAPSV